MMRPALSLVDPQPAPPPPPRLLLGGAALLPTVPATQSYPKGKAQWRVGGTHHAPRQPTGPALHLFFFGSNRPTQKCQGLVGKCDISAEPGSAYGIQLMTGPPCVPY